MSTYHATYPQQKLATRFRRSKMLSALTTKPLLWTAGTLALLLAASAALNVSQWKQIGAARVDCEVTKLEEYTSRSDIVRDLITESLRHQVATLEGEIEIAAAREKSIFERHSETELMLDHDARKATPDLDAPLASSVVERLRRHEESQ
jgi:Arc/MetJ-type ribon-helix-helix transcriptional regulator